MKILSIFVAFLENMNFKSHASSENISTCSVTVRSHFLATTGMGLKRVLNWTFTATHYGTWAKVIWVGTFLELQALFLNSEFYRNLYN